MRKIAGPGHVANNFVDYDPPGTPNGTVYTADYGNDVQDELVAIQDQFSIAEAAGTSEYILAAIKGIAKSHGKMTGELYWLDGFEDPVEFDKDDPDIFHPGLCLSAIDGELDISTANWAALVPHLRAQALIYLKGKAGEKTAFDVTDWSIVSNVAQITFANTTAENAVLAALAEDQLVHGSYSNWRSITLPGAIGDITAGDYAITDVDPVARTIDFAFTAGDNSGSGVFTVNFYPHRIVGSTTTARVFEINGRTLVSAGDADGEAFAGLLRRDRAQGHRHSAMIDSNSGAYDGSFGTTPRGTTDQLLLTGGVRDPVTDTTNGVPRVGLTTDPRSMIGHLYMHGRSYTA